MNLQLLRRKKLILILFLTANLLAFSQSNAQDLSTNLDNEPRVLNYKMNESRGTPSLIQLNPAKEELQVSEVPSFLKDLLNTGSGTEFLLESTINSHGVQVHKFQQYLNAVKVEHGVFKSISKNGVVTALTSEYYALDDAFSTTAGLSEDAALQKALNHVGAEVYAWEYIQTLGDSPEVQAAYEEHYPTGQLVIVDDYSTTEVDPRLAYKFNIYAAEPISRADIYVDANTGKILLEDAIIKHANGHSKEDIRKEVKAKKTAASAPFLSGTGDTRYAGTRNFDTSQDSNGLFVLKGFTPSGIENETLSYEGIGGLPLSIPALADLAVPIADGDGDISNPETADNIWTATEHRKDNFSTTSVYPIANEKNNDDVALDAHWGAEVVLDYWQKKHNRSSYDDKGTKVVNYVHYGDGYDNAFWNGVAMTYGDGSYQGGTNPDGSFAPLTSMDVCSHEIGHGICEFTADLVYARESGAMNEGFSDIWAATVEHYVLSEIDASLNYDPWGIGEQIDERDGGLAPGEPGARALRWMDDPKAAGDPDSYGGENWKNPDCGTPTLANDYCGVHTNSGVLNKWYYFLVEGSGNSFSPGYQKAGVDDLISDAGNNYEVEGLNFDRAAKITYIAETLLSPNAKFAEMREASIMVAQTLFGIGSFEEQQTTNAWHAVDIGERYSAGEPNTISFSDSNIQLFPEQNEINACDDFNTYNIVISAVDLNAPATIELNTAGSTASLGADFDLSATSLSFTGTEYKSITLTVYDDFEIEQNEEIVLSYIYNGKFHKQVYSIADNDFEPRTGKDPIELLPTETFEVDGFPQGWTVIKNGEGNNVWKVNGDLSAKGRAYISDGITDIPFYDQNSPSNTILRSGLINASGTSKVTVSFDWEAGGETDAVDPNIIFDYGEFVYSLDGATFNSVQKFVGSGPLAVNTESGSFTAEIPELDGKPFFLGWKWYNDTNAGTQFSFAIDNVKVTAMPAGIETEAGEQATTQVKAGKSIYFLSNTDNALIAKIENASEDLGCVTLKVETAGKSFKVFPNISTARPSKSFSITTENTEATYDLSIYFTDEELTAYEGSTDLIPIKVNSMNIDDADEREGNFQLNGTLTDVDTAGGFVTYTGTFSGSGSVSIVQDFEYCMNVPSPWMTSDIGNNQTPGELCYKEGSFEVSGSGNGFADKVDAFYFTYQELTGDAEIVARLSSFAGNTNESQAAVVIRESLDANSKMAGTIVTANPNLTGAEVALNFRKSTGGKLWNAGNINVTLPQYLKISRKGNEISSYISNSNGDWTLIGSVKFNLADRLYIGIGSSAGNNQGLSTATFDNVSINTGTVMASKKHTTQEKAEPNSKGAKEAKTFTLYPNPAIAHVNLSVEDSNIKGVSIYNLNGKMLEATTINEVAPSTRIDVSHLRPGLYIMKVYTDKGEVLNKRFLKK